MRSIRFLSVALVCVAAACAKSDKPDATDSANAMAAAAGTTAGMTAGTAAGTAAGTTAFAANGCVEGTWKKKDGAFTQTITFNADKTGEEVQSRDDKRSFEWTVKNDTTVGIHYTTAGSAKSDWNVSLDCGKGRLTNGVNSAFTK